MKDYVTENLRLFHQMESANDALFGELSDHFFCFNKGMIIKTAADLMHDVELGDRVAIVNLETAEELKNVRDGKQYLSVFMFWAIVRNRAKARIWKERGITASYSTQKRHIREGSPLLPPVPKEQASFDSIFWSQRTKNGDNENPEKIVIHKEAVNAIRNLIDTFPEQIRQAILTEWSDDTNDLSRSTYYRWRKKGIEAISQLCAENDWTDRDLMP